MVIAIIFVLAAILFPVFAQAKAASEKTVCASNFSQAHKAALLYISDYDDYMMPTNYQPTAPNSRSDRTWVQLVLPYGKNFTMFQCPSDTSPRPKPEATFDEDLIPGDTVSQYYHASQRSNIGYNYLYLAPIVKTPSQDWHTEPKSWAAVASPPESLLFIDTVHEVVDGHPSGGGSYLAIPPCRYYVPNSSATRFDTFLGLPEDSSRQVLADHAGWTLVDGSTFRYGLAWPWHQGRLTVVKLDGSSKAITTEQLAAGCDVQNGWSGNIQSGRQYVWDAKVGLEEGY